MNVVPPAHPSEPSSRRYGSAAIELDRAVKRFASVNQLSLNQALATIGSALGLSSDAVDSWRRGLRRIPEDRIEKFVRIIGYGTADDLLTREGHKLANRIRATRADVEPRLSWREGVERATIKLRVREAKYVGNGAFWGRIFSDFLSAADVTSCPHPASRRFDRTDNFDQLQEAVWRGDLDVGLGVLSTPRLNLKHWFFTSPINYRLNGVMLRADIIASGGLPGVRSLLGRPGHRRRTFLPIVMRGEVGEVYARNNLGLTDPIVLDTLEASAFASVLCSHHHRDRVPVAIVDEITCFGILTKLATAQLIFPLNPDRSDRVIPPSFRLGLCISRNENLPHARNSELRSFIHDALAQHIEGSAMIVAHYYLALRNHVRRLICRALPPLERVDLDLWLARTYPLGDAESPCLVEPPCWRAVLHEAISLGGASNRPHPGHKRSGTLIPSRRR